MTVPRPHDRPIRTYEASDEALDTFTVRLPQWRIFTLFRRNPLVRASDRVEALALVVAVMVSLLAIPIAAALGTDVYDSQRDVYAQQDLTDHTPTSQAGVDAVTAALFMWAGVTTAAAVLLASTRAVCRRIRARRWQHTIDTLFSRETRE